MKFYEKAILNIYEQFKKQDDKKEQYKLYCLAILLYKSYLKEKNK